jgi:uncharacterized membrane protein
MQKTATILITALFILYPTAVLLGLTYLEPKHVGGVLIVFMFLSYFLYRNRQSNILKHQWTLFLLGLGGCGVTTIIINKDVFLKFYPVFINMILFLFFFLSLIFPPSVIERFARLKKQDLSSAAIGYTRKVTVIWCFFFAANGGIALYTALFVSLRLWTVYNGFISYILIGVIFASELLYRQLVFMKSEKKADSFKPEYVE